MHLDIAVVGVGLARQQRLDRAPLRLLVELLELRLTLGNGGAIVLGLAQLDQRDAVIELALELLVGVDRALELLALAHDLLRRLGVIPEPGILGFVVQLGEPGVRGVPVKDASAGEREPP